MDDRDPIDTGSTLPVAAPGTGPPLSVRDAARLIGASEHTIRRAIARGDLTATKQAKIYRIDQADLANYSRRGAIHDRPDPQPSRIALPTTLSPLIGREVERDAIHSLVLRKGVRLVTLTGPGGVGKTCLAEHIAEEIAEVFQDGAVFVDLSPVRDPSLVLPAIAQAIGVRAASHRKLDEVIRAYLRPRELLLVLDNCEQVIEAAPGIADLIAACPALHILATSRAPFRIRDEHRFPVDPLPVPTSAHEPDQLLAESDAVQLFLARARAVDPALATTGDDLRAIAEICRRLDGLPLAIELAAAWSALLPPSDLLHHLADRMRQPGVAPRDLPARQRTVGDTIAWSYDLLPPAVKILFRRLAVFSNGFDLEAAVAIADAPPATVLDQLGVLIDQSLLRRVERKGDGPRYAMLETVRTFGWQQAAGQGETDHMRARHAAIFLALAEHMESVIHGSLMRQGLDCLEVEQANCLAALQYFVEIGDTTRELRLAAMLAEYWYFRGQMSEGIMALSGALERGKNAPPGPRAKAMAELAFLHLASGAHREAQRLSAASIPLARQAGNAARLAQALFMRGMVVSSEPGKELEAITLLQEAADLIRDHHLPMNLYAHVLVDLGAAWLGADDHERGLTMIKEALDVFRATGQHLLEAATLLRLGRMDRQQGRTRDAAVQYAASLRAYRDAGMVTSTGSGLVELAGLAAASGYPETAGRLVGMILAISDRTGAVFEGGAASLMTSIERQADGVMGRDHVTSVEQGRLLAPADALSQAIAIADALAHGKPPPSTKTPVQSLGHGPLSAREHEVLALLVQRYTAPEIADRLFISVRTVERHVANIYNKLGVTSRSAAIDVATDRGLVDRAIGSLRRGNA